MHHEKVHTLFWYMGRISIAIPLIIIALAFVFKVDQMKRAREEARKPAVRAIAPKNTVPSMPPVAVPKGSIVDVSKSQKCVATSSSGDSAEVYIANSNIYGEFTQGVPEVTTKVLVKGDCVYKWQKSAPTGEQICGVSGYMSILKTLSSTGLLDVNMFMDLVGRFGVAKPKASEIAKMEPVCAEQPIPDTIFAVEKGVTFVKKNIISPTQAMNAPSQVQPR